MSTEDIHKISNILESKLKIKGKYSLEESIERVRKGFLEIQAKNPQLYEECDIERVKTNEFTVKRFVLWNDLNIDKAIKQLDDAMKWRKTSEVNHKTDKDAPIEFFRAGAVFNLGEDKNGLPVIYFRAKTVIKIKKLQPILHLMTVNILNKIDVETNGNGFVCVMDVHEVGLKNADLDLIQFVINILRSYFPLALSRLIVYNIPWYLKGFVAVIKMWLSAEEQVLLKFASGEELFKYIDPENVPKYLGGKNGTDFTIVPEGCKPVIELCELYGVSKEEALKYMTKYEHLIEEGQKLVKNPEYYKSKKSKEEDLNNNEETSESEKE